MQIPTYALEKLSGELFIFPDLWAKSNSLCSICLLEHNLKCNYSKVLTTFTVVIRYYLIYYLLETGNCLFKSNGNSLNGYNRPPALSSVSLHELSISKEV